MKISAEDTTFFMKLGKAGNKRKKKDLEEYGKRFEIFHHHRKSDQLSKTNQLPKHIKHIHCPLSKAINHINAFSPDLWIQWKTYNPNILDVNSNFLKTALHTHWLDAKANIWIAERHSSI